MGMYDQIRFLQKLPDGYESDEWHQTKCLECLLVDYEVDADGQLWELGVCEVPRPGGKRKLTLSGIVIACRFIEDQDGKLIDSQNYKVIFEFGRITAIELCTDEEYRDITFQIRDTNESMSDKERERHFYGGPELPSADI